MTPLQPIVEVPRRIESWPVIWRVLLCSMLSMVVAVVSLAWFATRHPHATHSAQRWNHR